MRDVDRGIAGTAMSLSARKRRAAARAEKHADMHVVHAHAPGARVADVWFRPGAWSHEQVAGLVNASSQVVRAQVEHRGVLVEIKPTGWAVLRESAEKIGVEKTAEKFGVEVSDVERAIAQGAEP